MKGWNKFDMKKAIYNMGYFLNETRTIIKTDLLSNIFSLLCMVLIFFILSLIIAVWRISMYEVKVIEKDAQISVYYDLNLDNNSQAQLVENIKSINGINEVHMVSKEEAYKRMQEILGDDAQVLEFFDNNPFSPFLEVNIKLDNMNPILENLNKLEGVDYVRDNRQVLNHIKSIVNMISLLGLLFITAAGISTVVIISHIIGMGIQNNIEQVNTLKLLGAPKNFIAFPFLLEGLLLTVSGGLISSVFGSLTLSYIYSKISGPIPFLPLPPLGKLISNLIILLICISAVLGTAGSIFGLSSSREKV
jgi:cell division transport system permease protein